MSENFCGDCNRIRLTADGKMKNCLFSKNETDLLSALRAGEDVVSLIHQNIKRKAKELGGQFSNDFRAHRCFGNQQQEHDHNRRIKITFHDQRKRSKADN